MKTIRFQLEEKIFKEAESLWPGALDHLHFEIEHPKEKRFGDYSTNVAMQLAGELGEEAMEVAKKLVRKIKWPAAIGKVMVAAPGFLNFYLSENWLRRQVPQLIKDENFGQSDSGQGKKVQIEFISANPTGPLHIGNGRGAYMGDTLANVFKMNGYKTQREYYLNDMGKQVEILGESVRIRYFQNQGINLKFPEHGYKGEYINELAKKLKMVDNYKLKDVEKVKERIRDRALNLMIESIKKVVEKEMKVKFDKWYSEKSLYEKGIVEKAFQILKEKNLLYKSEGAIYVKTTLYGDDKDRVLIKNDEEPTYFLSDIAYHYDKIALRKFDRVIDIWGADHHGHQARMQAIMRALGYEGRLDIIIYQLVRLIENGQEVKMSKRGGTFVTLEELVEEVGNDVARFFFLMYSADTHMDFDLNLAKEKSDKNPVYYVQYAHARICSIIKNALKLHRQPKNHNSQKLAKKEEFDLLKELIKLPEVVENVAETYEVNKLPFYAQNLASRFHDFYTRCRVIENDRLNIKRFELIKLTKSVLEKTLNLMGISAPERM